MKAMQAAAAAIATCQSAPSRPGPRFPRARPPLAASRSRRAPAHRDRPVRRARRSSSMWRSCCSRSCSRRTTASSGGTASRPSPTSSGSRTTGGPPSDPVFIAAIGHNLFVVAMSLIVQGPIAIGVALLLNAELRGRAFFRVIIFFPYVLSEVITAVIWQADPAAGRPVRQLLTSIGLGSLVQRWLADRNVVLWTLFAVPPGSTSASASSCSWPASRACPPSSTEAGRVDGAELVADPPAHQAAAARPDDPDLGVPLDHRIAAAVRPGLDPHRRRPGQRDEHDGDLHGAIRVPPLPVRLRQRDRRHPVHHLLRVRPAVPAVRAPARPEGALLAGGDADDRVHASSRSSRRQSRFDWGQPVRLRRRAGHRRHHRRARRLRRDQRVPHHRADQRRPVGLAESVDCWQNYASVLSASTFWTAGAQQHASPPWARPSASASSGCSRRSSSRATGSAGATRSTRSSPPGCCSRSRSRSCRST